MGTFPRFIPGKNGLAMLFSLIYSLIKQTDLGKAFPKKFNEIFA